MPASSTEFPLEIDPLHLPSQGLIPALPSRFLQAYCINTSFFMMFSNSGCISFFWVKQFLVRQRFFFFFYSENSLCVIFYFSAETSSLNLTLFLLSIQLSEPLSLMVLSKHLFLHVFRPWFMWLGCWNINRLGYSIWTIPSGSSSFSCPAHYSDSYYCKTFISVLR